MTRQKTILSIAPILVLGFATLVGCAGIKTTERQLLVSGVPYEAPVPGTVLGSIEEAALAAVAHARFTANPAERDALLIGSIILVEGGYSWLEPLHSESYFQSTRRPVARLTTSREHVATNIVHPKTGDPRIDRANEHFSRSEKRLVDRAEPLHRPLFLLTPSGRIVSYVHEAPSVEIADLHRGRMPRQSAATKRRTAAMGSGGPALIMVGASSR